MQYLLTGEPPRHTVRFPRTVEFLRRSYLLNVSIEWLEASTIWWDLKIDDRRATLTYGAAEMMSADPMAG